MACLGARGVAAPGPIAIPTLHVGVFFWRKQRFTVKIAEFHAVVKMPTVAFNPGKPLTANDSYIVNNLVCDGFVAKTPSANFLNVAARGAGGEKQKFRFVTTQVVSKWGVSTAYEGRPQKPTLKMDVDQNEENQIFCDAMRDLVEPALHELAVKNAIEFIKKANRRSPEAIKSDFGRIIKPSADERYAPTISFKIPLATGTPEAEWGNPDCWNILVQDANGKEVPKSRLNERNLRVKHWLRRYHL